MRFGGNATFYMRVLRPLFGPGPTVRPGKLILMGGDMADSRNARHILRDATVTQRLAVIAQASAIPTYDGLPLLWKCDSRTMIKDLGRTSAGPCIIMEVNGTKLTKIQQILGVLQLPTNRKI